MKLRQQDLCCAPYYSSPIFWLDVKISELLDFFYKFLLVSWSLDEIIKWSIK